MKQVVVFEILFGNKLINEPKTLFRTVNHGDCNGAVQRNDGRWLRLCQRIIQADDLPPITIGGKRTLAELFDGRSQLILYSFMWRREFGRAASAAPSSPIILTARTCIYRTTT